MNLIIDTGRIIAALIVNGTTRTLLFSESFTFSTPDFTLSEIERHKQELLHKAKLSPEELDVLIALVFEHVNILPRETYKSVLDECKNDISDPDDTPFLAAALSHNTEGIWTHDKHFNEQQRVRVFTNIDLLNYEKTKE